MLRFLLAGLLSAAMAQAWAQERIMLAGVEASRDNGYAYLGAVLPLPGNRLGQGFVQRYWLDYDAYRYEKLPQQYIDTEVASGEAALGYQQSSARGWWGAYLGARYANMRLSPDDPDNDDRGWRLRAKLQFEGETEIGAGWRANGIASNLVGDANYWVRLRLHTLLRNQWHVGPEVIVQGDSNYSAYKVGEKVIADNALLIYPSTQQKLRDYQDLVVRSFYLENADAKTTASLLKAVLKTRDAYVDEKLNLIVMRDTPEAVKLAEKLIAAHDLAEPEVLLEVEVIEVTYSRLQELGIKWTDRYTFGLVDPTGGSFLLSDLKGVDSDRITINAPSATLNIGATDGHSNVLASPRVRVKNRLRSLPIRRRVPCLAGVV